MTKSSTTTVSATAMGRKATPLVFVLASWILGCATAAVLTTAHPNQARAYAPQAQAESASAADAGAGAGEADDADGLLAELAMLGDSMAALEIEAGGSIRAKRARDKVRTARLKDPKNLTAKVVRVHNGHFPLVAVQVKVLRPAQQGPGAQVSKNNTVVVVPRLQLEGGAVSMGDDATRLNAGAYYLQPGDKVMVRLGRKQGKVWEAAYIERR